MNSLQTAAWDESRVTSRWLRRSLLTIPGLRCSCVSELPSVALTRRFLARCEHHGSQNLVAKLVAVGRATGVPGPPCQQRTP